MTETKIYRWPLAKDPSSRWDRISVWAGFACAVHCALTPIVVLLVPSLGIGYLENPWLEATLLGSVLLVGGNSVLHGWRAHQRRAPLVLFVISYAGMCAEYFVSGPFAWPLRIGASIGLFAALLWARGVGSSGHDACFHENLEKASTPKTKGIP